MESDLSTILHLHLQVLLLAWKMGASRMGYFSRAEFTTGLKALNALSLDKLRKVCHCQCAAW
jgi:DCN1-like protein 4/5